jgi:hypothetical protein
LNAECHYAECPYAECRGASIEMAKPGTDMLDNFVNKPTLIFNFLTGLFFFFKTHFERVRKAFETSEKRLRIFLMFSTKSLFAILPFHQHFMSSFCAKILLPKITN